MFSSRRYPLILTGIFTVFLIIGGVYESSRYALFAVAILLSLTVFSEAYRRLQRRMMNVQKRLALQNKRSEGLSRNQVALTAAEVHSMSVIMQRFPEADLPTTSWSMRFTNLHLIAQLLDQHNPSVIIEFGSGLSTICIASWLKQRGRGRLVSFDHNEGWAEITRQHLSAKRIDDFASVEYAPLVNRQMSNGRTVNWYDQRVEELIKGLEIDFVVVDGPPQGKSENELNRLPALEVVAPYLAGSTILCLDDAKRPGEEEVVREWTARLPNAVTFQWPSSTGLAVVSCHTGTRAADEKLASVG